MLILGLGLIFSALIIARSLKYTPDKPLETEKDLTEVFLKTKNKDD